MSRARRITFVLAVAALYALHQDVWFWRTARPLLFGFIPVGLAYHGLFCLVSAVLMAVLARYAWPERLEAEAEGRAPAATGVRSR